MLRKIIFLSVMGMFVSDNCNGMRLFKGHEACRTSRSNINDAILNKMERRGAKKPCKHEKSNAYDIFIDALDEKQTSLGLENRDVLLEETLYSERYYKINGKTCEISDNILGIRQRIFASRGDLEHVKLPCNLLGIDSMAFGHSGLKDIYIPDSVVAIAPYAFAYCRDLRDVSVSSHTLILDDAFLGCYNIKIHYR